MTEAAHCTIVECEEIVEVGELKPEEINLPALYVNRVFKGRKFEHKVEVLKTREENQGDDKDLKEPEDARERIALRAAKEFKDGMQVNLGGQLSFIRQKESMLIIFSRHAYPSSIICSKNGNSCHASK